MNECDMQRAYLAELARECLEATMAGLWGHSDAEPRHFVDAFNRALEILTAGVQHTATTAGTCLKNLGAQKPWASRSRKATRLGRMSSCTIPSLSCRFITQPIEIHP